MSVKDGAKNQDLSAAKQAHLSQWHCCRVPWCYWLL